VGLTVPTAPFTNAYITTTFQVPVYVRFLLPTILNSLAGTRQRRLRVRASRVLTRHTMTVCVT
jgi:hypothetical protein